MVAPIFDSLDGFSFDVPTVKVHVLTGDFNPRPPEAFSVSRSPKGWLQHPLDFL